MNVPSKRYGEFLTRYLQPQTRRAVLMALLLLSTIGLQLANPQLLRTFLDAALAGAPNDRLTAAGLIFLAIIVVQQVSTIFTTYLSESVGWTATNFLRADLAHHCLRLDLNFHKQHTPGEMIERIDGDVNALGNFFSQLVIRVFGNALLLLGVLVLMYLEDWRLGAGFSLFAVVALGALNQMRSVAVPHFKAAREASAQVIGFIEERLSGTEDIRANGFVSHVLQRFYRLERERLRKHQKSGFMGSLMYSTNQAVFTLGYAIAFALGAYLYGAAAITLGTVYLVVHYMEMLQRPLSQIIQQMEDLQRASASISRIDDLLHLESAVQDGPGATLLEGPLGVDFDCVSFSYETKDEGSITNDGRDAPFVVHPSSFVLQDVSFTLAPGRILGLLGRTGSGKSTLTKLIFRFYDATEGVVRIGGTDVRRPTLHQLRSRIGLVMQDVQLFHGTVRQNLTLLQSGISDERIMQAIVQLGLSEWYGRLPVGLDTPLNAGAAGLSAGEAQLLAFTRVFLRDPGLVIMDEASSRLDPATERMVEGAIDRLLHHRTAIIIAHRLSTVQRADQILILEDGRIAEQGARADLTEDPSSRFNRLKRTGMELALA
ncbi:MAG TPA: ABC transporter ATP-binding protein [Chloroflexota bacterium]|nr:ABC transporter ATP-binding protein [Chloroflexota bacterium]